MAMLYFLAAFTVGLKSVTGLSGLEPFMVTFVVWVPAGVPEKAWPANTHRTIARTSRIGASFLAMVCPSVECCPNACSARQGRRAVSPPSSKRIQREIPLRQWRQARVRSHWSARTLPMIRSPTTRDCQMAGTARIFMPLWMTAMIRAAGSQRRSEFFSIMTKV